MLFLDQIGVLVKKKIRNVYLVDYDMKGSIEGRNLIITLSVREEMRGANSTYVSTVLDNTES